VSVVATGIDHIVTAARPQAEARVAEIQKLRPEAQRAVAERVERPAPAHQTHAMAQSAQPRPSIEQAATAAVAAALAAPSTADDVTIRPITPKPSLFVEPVMAEPAPQETPKAFIPPQPERVSRAPRMPRLEDLPIPAQNEIRASRGEAADSGPEKQRMTLLQRLAQVGLGRRDDVAAVAPPRSAMPAPAPAPQPQHAPPRGHDAVSEYAKRPPAPAPQGLDMHGRQSLPVHKPVDDDQLEIPAFLRRQAN
jgi:cell division protein FtsZ